eukprot:GHVN01074766.1.p1 GENE.GHVN01074766.1~~GHVN01074766.1.p1  ORF type:complete len:113 (+),score=3.26 GHVN01074766.1:615-953(+)
MELKKGHWICLRIILAPTNDMSGTSVKNPFFKRAYSEKYPIAKEALHKYFTVKRRLIFYFTVKRRLIFYFTVKRRLILLFFMQITRIRARLAFFFPFSLYIFTPFTPTILAQ